MADLLTDLQNCLGQQGDLHQLMESAIQAPIPQRDLIADMLLDWGYKEVVLQKDEDSFVLLCGWLGQLLGTTMKRDTALSKLCYQFAVATGKTGYLYQAASYLEEALRREPEVFQDYQFWAKILLLQAKWTGDEEHVERALRLYEQAEVGCGATLELLWDWALAWMALYDFSLEPADLQQGLELFRRARTLHGKFPPQFIVDYAQILQKIALATGQPTLLRQNITGLVHARTAVASLPKTEKVVYRALVEVYRYLVSLTQDTGDCEQANRMFEEAITAHPDQADIWVMWGHMLWELGWTKKDPHLLESALDKLTSLKLVETGDPLTLAYLSRVMMSLGVTLENIKLLFDGMEKLTQVVRSHPHHDTVRHVQAFSALAKAIYFLDDQLYEDAVERYTYLITEKSNDCEAWMGICEAYTGLAKLKQDPLLACKASQAALRLVELRPHASFYQTQLAQLLLLRYRLQPNMKQAERLIGQVIEHLHCALTLKEEVATYVQMAQALSLLGDMTAGETSYLKAIQILENLYTRLPTDLHLTKELGRILVAYGMSSLKPESLFQAHHLLEQVLKRDPEEPVALGYLGCCKLALSELAADPYHPEETLMQRCEAERLLKQAVQAGSHEAIYHLARLFSAKGLYIEAVDCLKHAQANHVLPSITYLENDTWLAGVRQTEAFHEFLEHLKES